MPVLAYQAQPYWAIAFLVISSCRWQAWARLDRRAGFDATLRQCSRSASNERRAIAWPDAGTFSRQATYLRANASHSGTPSSPSVGALVAVASVVAGGATAAGASVAAGGEGGGALVPAPQAAASTVVV